MTKQNDLAPMDSNSPAIHAMTFADARAMILATIVDMKNGTIPVAQGAGILAGMKMLHDNVQVEINLAKLAIATEGKAQQFGKLVARGSTPLVK